MVEIINARNSELVEKALLDFQHAGIVCFDTETTGLRIFQNDRLISVALYFPEFERGYNFPFRHGMGTVLRQSDPTMEAFDKLTWQTDTKKRLYTQYWIDSVYRDVVDFENLDEQRFLPLLRRAWNERANNPEVLFIGHNVRFDLHVLSREGFDAPLQVHDTMVGLQFVWNDWNSVTFKMPNGGVERGSRGLKWQADFWNLYEDGDPHGEDELYAAMDQVKFTIAKIAAKFSDDPVNTKVIPKKASEATITEKAEYTAKKVFIDRKGDMWLLPSSAVANYALMDVVLTYRLYNKILKVIESWGQTELHTLKQDTHRHLAWTMEHNGIKLSKTAWQREVEQLNQDLSDTLLDWKEATGGSVNIDSPKQLLAFLQANVNKHLTSTDHESLEQHSDHPIVALILRVRRTERALYYLNKWSDSADENAIVHPGMNSDGTVSWRWSSSGDAGNFQNIPDRGGFTVKRVLVPYSPEWVFVAVDYGQLEARIGAWIAEVLELLDHNQTMTRLFEEGADMHLFTMEQADVRNVVFRDMSDEQILAAQGYTPSDFPQTEWAARVKKETRQIAKTMNFGLLYGGTGNMLSKLLRIDRATADILVKRWQNLFPAFPRANRVFKERALLYRPNPTGHGTFQYIEQPSGLVRKFDKYPVRVVLENGAVYNQREAEARKAWNNVVQGYSGHICVTSGLRIVNTFGADILRPFAQIHDALEFMVHRDHLYIVQEILRIMTDWDTRPKLTVDWSASPDNWHDLKTVKNFDLWVRSGGKEGY